MKPIRPVLIAAAALLFAGLLHAQSTVMPQAAFSGDQGKGSIPKGWTLGNKWAPDAVEIFESEGTPAVRFQLSTRGTSSLHTQIPVEPEWKKLRISVEMRVSPDFVAGEKQWTGARVGLSFQDAGGQRVGDWPKSPKLREGDGTWRKFAILEPVPEGATKLDFAMGLFDSSGTLEVRKLSVVVVE